MSDVSDLPATRSLSVSTRAAQRAALEIEVGSGRPPRQARTRSASILAGAAVLLAATTGAAVIHHQSAKAATETSEVRCYSAATLGSDSSFRGLSSSMAVSADGSVTTPDPIDLCGSYWRAGIIRPDARNARDPSKDFSGNLSEGTYPTPALVGCVLDSGIAAVFPGDASTCDTLGLAALATTRP
jgi:hypothetical protein